MGDPFRKRGIDICRVNVNSIIFDDRIAQNSTLARRTGVMPSSECVASQFHPKSNHNPF
jgi:hypothetical protein